MTTTNADQFEILVSFMEQNEGIAKNYLNSLQYKETTSLKWNEVKERLNTAGPPEKTVDGWKKVWKDFKYNTRNKVRKNKKSISGTGGGPCRIKRLNNLEDCVTKLLDFNGEVAGINVARFGCEILTLNNQNITAANPGTSTNNEHADIVETVEEPESSHNFQEESLTATNENTTNIRQRNRKPKEIVKSLLKEQIKNQEIYYCSAKRQGKDIIRVLKDKLQFEKQKWAEKQEMVEKENQAKQVRFMEKAKQKYDELELKRMELDIREKELNARDMKESKTFYVNNFNYVLMNYEITKTELKQ